MTAGASFFAKARTDGRDWLVEADEPLAGLQLRSGGELPGIIATPALLELVRKARRYGLKLARPIQAQDDREKVTAWVEVQPEAEGCTIGLANWQAVPLSSDDPAIAEDRRAAIERHLAELSARLGPDQEVISVDSDCDELAATAARLREGLGRRWTELIEVEGDGEHRQPLHWRLLDGARVSVPGSARHWKAVLLPLGQPEPGQSGFDLLFVADEPPVERAAPPADAGSGVTAGVGRDIAPVLRQPIARIIANAETIRTQLAGPLAEEYSKYAADIASAGEHLLGLLDDLADLEVVEAADFAATPDTIDLADVARRAAGLLAMRARERGIELDAPKEGESVPAIGEFRRVLQISLNLLGNALRYSPEGSQVWLRAEAEGSHARLTVADQGQGLSLEQQAKVFDKFERLGRSGDGGSGLGLYISRRLARAMHGDLTIDSAPGQGARFTLELPSFPERRKHPR